MKIDLDQIRNLLAVVSQTDITELTIESGEEKITVKKSGAQITVTPGTSLVSNGTEQVAAATLPLTAALKSNGVSAPAPAPVAPKAEPAPVSAESTAGLVAITSPMVGTFYRAPSPTSPSFVEVGDRISIGQTVCIIEAMKLMNDLPAEISGKVVQILVENGATVEFGQQLILVDPKG